MKVLHEWLMTRPGADGAVELYIRTLVLLKGEEPFGLVAGADFAVEGQPTWPDILTCLGVLASKTLSLVSQTIDQLEITEGELVGAKANSGGPAN